MSHHPYSAWGSGLEGPMHVIYYFTICSPRGVEINQADRRGGKCKAGVWVQVLEVRESANCQAAGWQSMDAQGEVREVSRGQGSLCRKQMPLRGGKWGHFERLPFKTHHSLEQICSSYSMLHANTRILLSRPFGDAWTPPP